MARIVIIGGSGHVGTYLVPALVDRGHEVVNVSRGTASPYLGSRIAGLNADVVIDMISFELDGTQQLVQAATTSRAKKAYWRRRRSCASIKRNSSPGKLWEICGIRKPRTSPNPASKSPLSL
jgi:putative NADH-flavin reductase